MDAFRYRIVTEWSDEDGAFIGRVPALAGCAAHGATAEEASKQAREAALAILESIQAHRETPPPEDASVDYSGQLRLRLPKSLHERIALLATAEELSINSLLVSMISEAVGQRRTGGTALQRAVRAAQRGDRRVVIRPTKAGAVKAGGATRKQKGSAGNLAR